MRNPVFDLLRIILALLVINLHVRNIASISPNFLEPFTWYTVTTFVVMSFYFTGTKDMGIRLKRLIFPLLFWSILGFVVHPELLNLKNVFLQLVTGQVVNTPLYYLVLLSLFTLINWLINFFPTKVKVLIYSVILLLAFYLEYSELNFLFFSHLGRIVATTYGRFFELIKFVPVGLTFAYLSKKVSSRNFLVLSVLFFILSLVCTLIPQSRDFHFSGLTIFYGVSAIFSFTLWLSHFKLPDKIGSLISFLGKYSFGVYLSHYLIFEFLLRVFPKMKIFIISQNIFFLLIYTTAVYLFCWGFDVLTRKKLSFLVK